MNSIYSCMRYLQVLNSFTSYMLGGVGSFFNWVWGLAEGSIVNCKKGMVVGSFFYCMWGLVVGSFFN